MYTVSSMGGRFNTRLVALALCIAAGCSSTEPPPGGGAGGATGSGGATGIGGATASGGADGGDECATIAATYGTAFQNALECDPSRGSSQCTQLGSSDLLCGACPQYVNDATELDHLRMQYSLSCPPVLCPLCLEPGPTACVPVDGGATGICTRLQSPAP
jgi:hypothetical protein